MDRRTLTLLACGVVFLMILVAFVGKVMGGLPEDIVALMDAEIQNYERDKASFANAKSSIDKAIESEPILFRSPEFKQGWPERLSVAQGQLDAVQKDIDRLRALKAENKRDTSSEIAEILTRTRAARVFAVNEATEMSSAANYRLDFKRNRKEKILELKSAYDAAAGTNFSAIQSRVEQAIIDWPNKRDDLNNRLQAVTRSVERATADWQTIQNENAKFESGTSESGPDFEKMIRAATALTEISKSIPANIEQIGNLVAQLYRSWDKILVDMQIREDLDVTFRQKLKIVEVAIKDAQKKENEQSVREEWRQVSESQYKAMEKNLGMTVEHKSAGKYDSEAETVAQPAGYAYIAPQSQGRNQYGEWRSGSGGSFWVFYGQYAFMRNLFWGPRYYRPIFARDYGGYYGAYRSGRTYYGRDFAGRQRYGTGGSFTRSRYSTSSYNRSGGFRNTRYVRSGGTYRGSRFETRSSSRGSRRGSYRSSGSRFGRGK